MRFRAALIGLLSLGTAIDSSLAQSDAGDQRPLFTWRDGLLAGGFVVGTLAIRPLDKSVAGGSQTDFFQKNHYLKTAALGFNKVAVPGSTIIGISMYGIGRLAHDRRTAELGLHGLEAIVVGAGVSGALKGLFGRARPYVDTVPNPDNWQLLRGFSNDNAYKSFPSGHSVAAFAAAAAVVSTTSSWWPDATWVIAPTMYGGAALVGLSRIYDNRHWASDVIMGAAIGTFAGTKVVRYHRTHPGNRLDKWLLNASASPGDLSHITLSLIPLRR